MGHRTLKQIIRNFATAGRVAVLSLAVALGWGVPLAGQEDLSGRQVFSSGLVVESEGEDWAFIAWRSTETDLLFRRPVAVYSKPGLPEDPGTYERVSVANVQEDPNALAAIVTRAERMGESPEDLEVRVDELFHDLIPDDAFGLGEKLSAVIKGGIADPDLQENLLLQARNSPALGMALGQAYAGPVEGVTTFELRELDEPGGEVVRVFGRATVDPENPVVLPPPGRPRDVTLDDPRGHLNVRLLWAHPEPLREMALLNYGFNVYRVKTEYAEASAQGWDNEPPEAGVLAEEAEAGDEVVRINRFPALADETLTENQAAALAADPEEDRFFVTDDNDRRSPEDEAFEDGDQFYYFVAARDLLGRDGEYSEGTLVTVCKRLPPVPTQQVEVENVYEYEAGQGEQSLRVRWRQNDPDDPRTAAANYYVYRWDSLEEMHARSGDPSANLVGGPIPHLPGETFNHFDDDGTGAPTMPEDAGRTVWYTVRAEDDSVCGGNLSGNSPPAFGVLRDREGPEGPDGGLEIACALPEAIPPENSPTPGDETIGAERMGVRVSVERLHPEIAWAEFYVTEGDFATRAGFSEYLGRKHFDLEGADYLATFHALNFGSGISEFGMNVVCRVGTYSGQVSDFVSVRALFESGRVTEIPFMADVDFVRGEKGVDCGRHTSRNPGAPAGAADVEPVRGTIGLTPGTREWKLYRRVDDGPLRLLRQGEGDFDEQQAVSWADDNMPASASTRICYFAQVFDEHGNASPMVRIDCTEVVHSDLPEPILASATPLEEDAQGRTEIELRWFCPPAGVERFEVWLAPAGESGAIASDGLSGPLYEHPQEKEVGDRAVRHRVYHTSRIDGGFGEGAEFSVALEAYAGIEYEAVVRAVGAGEPDGNEAARPAGSFSNRLSFSWHEPESDPGPEVPWPQRPLPARAELDGQDDRIEVRVLQGQSLETQFQPFLERGLWMAIKLGEYRLENEEGDPVLENHIFPVSEEPNDLFFPLNDLQAGPGEGEEPVSLFPFAVYRAYVSGPNEGQAPGTLVQVAPLMREVAYEKWPRDRVPDEEEADFHLARDGRFLFRVHEDADADSNAGPTHEIFFMDNHPAVAGGEYRYLLVRYRPDGEIAQVLVSPPKIFEMPN